MHNEHSHQHTHKKMHTYSYTWINSKSKGWYTHAHMSSQSFFCYSPIVVVIILSTYKIWNYFKTLFACFIIIKNMWKNVPQQWSKKKTKKKF